MTASARSNHSEVPVRRRLVEMTRIHRDEFSRAENSPEGGNSFDMGPSQSHIARALDFQAQPQHSVHRTC